MRISNLACILVIASLFLHCDANARSANCVIAGDIIAQKDFEGDATFQGEIRNNGNARALFVEITFAIKNSDGSVIGNEFTFVNSTNLDPGQASPFKCYTDIPYSQISSWDYEITWNEENSKR